MPPHDRPVAVFFLHVSSSGGTAVCRLAQEQPCSRVPSCGANCNLNCRHPWDWRQQCVPPACVPPARPCRPPHKPGCAGLRRWVAQHNLTFVASETMLTEGGLCPDFVYVTVLRDPVARLQSQLERMSSQPNHKLHQLLSQPRVLNTSVTTSLMGTPALDNYLVRLLLGPPTFFLPLRAINASHFAAASRVLAGFAAAVPLDGLNTDGATWLRGALRWRGAPRKANHHRLPGAAPLRPPTQPAASGRRLSARHQALGERSLRLLRELNRYDLQLYAEATARFRQSVRQGSPPPLELRQPRCTATSATAGPQCPTQGRRVAARSSYTSYYSSSYAGPGGGRS